jgi:predicted transcriptional regulator
LEDQQQMLVALTADIVSAHVANNNVSVSDVTSLIQNVHDALQGLGTPAVEAPQEKKVGLVSVRASVTPDYLVCMACGTKHKMLKRHLLTAHGLSPDEYRADYGLTGDYPLVASNYSETRRGIAHASGLGRKREFAQPEKAPKAA